MKKLSYIVFDVGGVLLNWRQSSNALAAKLGVTRDTLFDVLFDQSTENNIGSLMTIGQLSNIDGWTKVLRYFDTSLTPTQVIEAWHAKSFWFNDTLQLVRDLHSAGYSLAIMSNSWLGLTKVEKSSVFPDELALFEKIFDSSIEKLKKPDPRFFSLVEDQLGVEPHELLLIDDTAKNIEVAKARNWQGFLYESGDEGRKSNRQLRAALL